MWPRVDFRPSSLTSVSAFSYRITRSPFHLCVSLALKYLQRFHLFALVQNTDFAVRIFKESSSERPKHSLPSTPLPPSRQRFSGHHRTWPHRSHRSHNHIRPLLTHLSRVRHRRTKPRCDHVRWRRATTSMLRRTSSRFTMLLLLLL